MTNTCAPLLNKYYSALYQLARLGLKTSGTQIATLNKTPILAEAVAAQKWLARSDRFSIQRAQVDFINKRQPTAFYEEPLDIRKIRLNMVPSSTTEAFQEILRDEINLSEFIMDAKSLAKKIGHWEFFHGTANAFALGAFVCSGITGQDELLQNAQKLDELFNKVQSRIRPRDRLTQGLLLRRIKNILWEMAPERFSTTSSDFTKFRLSQVLENYEGGVEIGHCVALTTLDNILLMKFGIEAGFVAREEHVYSLVGTQPLDNTIADLKSAQAAQKDKVRLHQVYNHLGFLAAILNCHAMLKGEQGDMAEAERLLNIAWELCPNYDPAFHSLGVAIYQRWQAGIETNLRKAEQYLLRAFALQRHSIHYVNSLVILYEELYHQEGKAEDRTSLEYFRKKSASLSG